MKSRMSIKQARRIRGNEGIEISCGDHIAIRYTGVMPDPVKQKCTKHTNKKRKSNKRKGKK